MGDSKKVSDYDEKEIAGPESQAYKDAVHLVEKSGRGATQLPAFLSYGGQAYGGLAHNDAASAALVESDKPDMTEFNRKITVPDAKQVEAGHRAEKY